VKSKENKIVGRESKGCHIKCAATTVAFQSALCHCPRYSLLSSNGHLHGYLLMRLIPFQSEVFKDKRVDVGLLEVYPQRLQGATDVEDELECEFE
jgi:hypothetical protein